MMNATTVSERVLERIRGDQDELIDLATQLIACDTTARETPEPARDEARLQEILAGRLRALGAEVDLWEPDPIKVGDYPQIPYDLDFEGRPQLLACLPGSGGGRSLLLDGHIDAVTPGERSRWTSDPFTAEIRDGRLYGRGANDMKGGLASSLFALECLRREGVTLRGDVLYGANTDEESSGAGGLKLVERGARADGGLCAEPTGFEIWVAARGTLTICVRIPGRSGHAEMAMPHWRAGGAVNAIEKLEPMLATVRRLREEWRGRDDSRHPLLSTPDIVPTLVRGGEWIVTYPDSCELSCDVQYLPARVDECGWAQGVREELVEAFSAAAAADPWLADHPIGISFLAETVPAEVAADEPIVLAASRSASRLGRQARVAGLDSWHDAATFTLHGTPTVSFGPGGIETAHAVDECVSVADLVDHCCATALVAMEFCGV